MTSMTIMGLSMITLGTVLYFRDSLEDTAAMTILPILCVSVYLFAFGAGILNYKGLWCPCVFESVTLCHFIILDFNTPSQGSDTDLNI